MSGPISGVAFLKDVILYTIHSLSFIPSKLTVHNFILDIKGIS